MATKLADKMKADGVEDEIVEDVEEAEDQESKDSEEPQVNVRVSRRKAAHEAREAELAELRQRAEQAERSVSEVRSQHEREMAEIRHQQQMLMLQAQQRQQPAPTPGEPVDEQIRKLARQRDEALAQSKLDDYHDMQDKISALRREQEIKALREEFEKKTQQVQQQFAAPLGKPAWVTAIEFQYSDVVQTPGGQMMAAAFESIEPGEWGPEKLHRMMQRARAEIAARNGGQTASRTNGHSNGNGQQRALFSGSPSTTGRARSSGNGDVTSVKIPKSSLATADKFGISRADYAKSWKESYGNDE